MPKPPHLEPTATSGPPLISSSNAELWHHTTLLLALIAYYTSTEIPHFETSTSYLSSHGNRIEAWRNGHGRSSLHKKPDLPVISMDQFGQRCGGYGR
jgi:hypothetical protein